MRHRCAAAYVAESDTLPADVEGSPTDVTGPGGFSWAPILADGNYNDVLRPCEEFH